MTKTTTIALAAAIAAQPVHSAADLLLINNCGEEFNFHLLRYSGTTEEIQKGIPLAFRDSCTVFSNYFGSHAAIYIEFASGTDRQYDGHDREEWLRPPNRSHRQWVNSFPTREYGAVYFWPIDLPQDGRDTTLVLRIDAVSDCLGICTNGSGEKRTAFDHYNGSWKNGLPDGSGIYVRNDTTYDGNWQGGLKHGPMKITTTDGYVERAEFYEGVRHGKSFTKLADGRTRMEYHYRNGVKNGDQLMTYRTEDGRMVTIYHFYKDGKPTIIRRTRNRAPKTRRGANG